jgi:hypothetical protein
MMRMKGMREVLGVPVSTMGWATLILADSMMTRPVGCNIQARTDSTRYSNHSLPELSLPERSPQFRNMGGISRKLLLITRKRKSRSQLGYKSNQMRGVKTHLS